MINLNNIAMCENCFAQLSSTSTVCPHCGYSPAAAASRQPLALPMSTILMGKYVVGMVLGMGGFGITYLAYDVTSGRKVAIKEYFPSSLASRYPGGANILILPGEKGEDFKKGSKKFYEEAELLSHFNGNPNIISVYEFFYQNNTAYYVMEFLDGEDLAHYLKKEGQALSAGKLLYLLDKVTDALMIVHSTNTLHRDITPDNIFVCRNGTIKLIDFGAARHYMTQQSQTLSVILKEGFAPVEQYQKNGKQGPWTDIYALGATCYYMLTGKRPLGVFDRMQKDNVDFGNMPTEVARLLRAMMAIQPEKRPQNVFVLKSSLQKIAIRRIPLVHSSESNITPITPQPVPTPIINTNTNNDSPHIFSKLSGFFRDKNNAINDAVAKKAAEEEARRAAQQAAEEKARRAAQQAAEEEARRAAQQAAEEEARRAAQQAAEEKARRAAQQAAEEKARRAAQQAAEEEARRAAQQAAEEEARRAAQQAAEEEARRAAQQAAEEEARRAAQQAAEEEARRAAQQAAEEEARRAAQLAAEEEARRAAQLAAEEEARRAAQQAAEEEARRAAQLAAEEEARRAAQLAAEEEARRAAQLAAEEEARRAAQLAAEEEARKADESETEKLYYNNSNDVELGATQVLDKVTNPFYSGETTKLDTTVLMGMTPPVGATVPVDNKKKKKSGDGKKVIILAAAVILAIIAIVAILLLVNRNAPSGTPDDTLDPTVTTETPDTIYTPDTTEAPVETTVAPETTEAPVETTAAPETTEAPVETTAVPETTEAPVETTAVPETTEAPETSAPETISLLEFEEIDDNSYKVSGIGEFKGTDLVIPATYNGKPVTAIGSNAFSNNENITSVTIPSGITEIGESAFHACTNLSTVNLSVGLKTIKNYAFRATAISEITIPETVESMGDNVFAYASYLSTVHYNAINCSPDWIHGITYSIPFPDSPISTITIGDKVEVIPKGIFWSYTYPYPFTSIVIPKSVKIIDDFAFHQCPFLNTVYYEGTEYEWKNIIIGEWNDPIHLDAVSFNYKK